MIGYLIGNRLGDVVEVWEGTKQELIDRFEYTACSCGAYTLRIYDGDPTLDGSPVVEIGYEHCG